MFLFLLLAAAAAEASVCLVRTTLGPTPYAPDPPPPLCAYATSVSLGVANLTAAAVDGACVDSPFRPLVCSEVVPVMSYATADFAASFSSCDPLRACGSNWIITPSFRYGALQNSMAVVLPGEYWTQSDANGSYVYCGVSGGATLLSNNAQNNCSTTQLPVVCLCVNPATTAAPTAA